jgi:hypothetical protein
VPKPYPPEFRQRAVDLARSKAKPVAADDVPGIIDRSYQPTGAATEPDGAIMH